MPIVESNNLRLNYVVSGDGEPVVLLTGIGTDHTAWDLAQTPALVDAGYRCIGIDHRDSGQSDASQVQYSIKDMAQDVAAVIKAETNGPAHIVGFSMGGMIAQELALAKPNLVQTLTLCCTDAGQSPMVQAILSSWALVRPNCDLRTFWQILLPWCFGEPFLSQAGAQDAVLDGVEANPHPQTADAFDRQCQAIIAHDSRDRLAGITAPTHVIAGELDLVHPVSSSEVLAKAIANTRLSVIPNVGHAAMWEDSARFNNALLVFLDRHRLET